MLTIRRAERSDATVVAQLLTEAFVDKFRLIFGGRTAAGRKALAEEFLLHKEVGFDGTFVAEVDGQPVGFVTLLTRETPPTPLWPAFRAFWRHLGPCGVSRALIGLPFLQNKVGEEDCCVEAIGVRSDWRRKGMGRRLLEGAEWYARSKGKSYLTLTVSDSNEGAKALYEKVGFVIEGEERSRITSWLFGISKWIPMRKPMNQQKG